MKKILILLNFFLFFNKLINAQIPFSLSNSTIFIPSGKSIISDAENYYISYADNNKNSINIYYKSSTLGFEELSTYGIGGNFRLLNQFQLYFGLGYFGFDLMNELNVTTSVSVLIDYLSLGISGQYNRAIIKDFFSEGIFSCDIFGKVFTDNYSIGFLISNINQAKYSNYENTIHQRAIFTAGYDINQQISTDIGTIIVFNSGSSLLLSAKYRPIEEMSLNIKYLFKNNKLTMGLSLTPTNWITLNIFFNHHEIFGSDYNIINQIYW